MKTKLSNAQRWREVKERAKELAAAGATRREIAQEVGLPYNTVAEGLRHDDIAVVRQSYTPRPRDSAARVRWLAIRPQVLELAAKGAHCGAIADAVGMNYGTLYYRLRQDGITVAPCPNTINEDTEAYTHWLAVRPQVLAMAGQGATRSEIAAAVGLPYTALCHRIAKEGIDVAYAGPSPRRDVDPDIVRWYDEGWSLTEIGKRKGLTRERIRQLVKKWRLPPRPKGFRSLPLKASATAERDAELERQYRSVDAPTLEQLAERHGMRRDYVRAVLHKRGVPLPPRPSLRALSDDDVAQAVADYVGGASSGSLAARYGISGGSMGRYLRAAMGDAAYNEQRNRRWSSKPAGKGQRRLPAAA